MKNAFRILVVAFACLASFATSAQQDAMHTQYVINKLLVNPAYAGYKELPSLSASHRSQWVGFKGAPMTQVASFDTPLKKDELATGITLIHDKLGPQSSIGISGSLAYRLRLTNRATLSFGGVASCELYQAKLTELTLTSDFYNQQDDYFMYNTKNLILPNVGFGVYYYKKNYFVSLSVPKMIRNKLHNRSSDIYGLFNGKQEPTVYLMGGQIFKINKEVKIQPNFIVKGQWGAPLSIGTHVNALLQDQFNVGVFYYFKEIAGLMLQWQANPQLKVGYSMDFPTSALASGTFGSHELGLTFNIATKRKRIIYPRYF